MNRRTRLVVRRISASSSPHQFNETSEPWSFARPRARLQHALTVTPNYSPNRRHNDVSLPSPSTSEISRADSIDAAPSLVSDSGSTLSSHGIELLPLNGTEYYTSRQPSLPVDSQGHFVEQYPTHRPQQPRSTTPSTPIHLPSLQLLSSTLGKQRFERDSRMNLSSLLA